MKKTALVLSALAFSIGMAMGPMTAVAAETASSSTQQLPSLAPMLEKVMPSVVSINVEGSTTVNTPKMPQQFQQFFGEDSPFRAALALNRGRLIRARSKNSRRWAPG